MLQLFICAHGNLLRRFFSFALILLAFVAGQARAADRATIAIAYPALTAYKPSEAARIQRGEYLAKAGDCIACHTDTMHAGKSFSGNLSIKTPFGTFYTPNITPDKQTGIGTWNDQQFIRAMREGLAPNHDNYFPVFPYLYFNRISDQDLKDIKFYLDHLPPTHETRRKDDVPFPFNVRLAQWGWKLLFFYPNRGQFQPDAKHNAEWNRGAYLVEGLEHCGMCHTPINLLGAPKLKYAYTGNFIDGYYAPNISGARLKDYSIEQIVNVFKTGVTLSGRGKVGGPMAEVNSDSLRYLNDRDLRAIAVYMKSTESKQPPVSKSKGGVTVAAGKVVYANHCAQCHTTGAAGAPKLGDATTWDPRIAQGMDTLNNNAIMGINSMPAMGACPSCSQDDIKAGVLYLVAMAQKSQSTGAAAPSVPRLTMADGQAIYRQRCSICHSDGQLGAPKVGDKAAWAPRIDQGIDILVANAIHGIHSMPAKGTCYECTNGQLMAAVIYMVQQSKTSGDYSLWLGS